MHVLFIPSWYPENTNDFHGSFFREQAEAIAKTGNKVGVLYCKEYSLHQINFAETFFKKMLISKENSLNVFRSNAIRWMPKKRLLNLKFTERKVRKMYRRYVELFGKPDVLHAHAMFPAGVVTERLAKTENIPFVITEHRHETALQEMREEAANAAAKHALSKAKAAVAVSPNFVKRLNDVYESDKWQFIPNLLPEQFEALRLETKHHKKTSYVFGHVSNLTPKKGVKLLLNAFKEAFNNTETVVLRVAGESGFLAELKTHAQQIGLKNVIFVGFLGRQEILTEFLKYDAFVLPSDSEPFGVVFWEAMATGIPVIATATDGGKNAVGSNKIGKLIKIGSQSELVTALQEIIEETYDAEYIRSRAVEHCGFETFTKQYLRLYSKSPLKL